MQLQFNWWAVIVSTCIAMFIPAIWYAPKVFGDTWLRLSGISPEQAKEGLGSALALSAVCSFGLAFAMAGFLNYLGSQSFLQGALAGFQFWIGFSLTQLLVDYRFSKRPWKLTFINAGHSGLSMVIIGGLLAVWK